MSLERRATESLESPIGRKVVFGAAVLAGVSATAGAAITYAGLMGPYFWIAVGGALGTTGRYWLSGVVARSMGETFPWGTLLINVTGSLVIGLFATLTGPDGRVFVGATARQFVMIGLCGGYTTFSSFSLQTLNLMNDGEWFQAGTNIVASVVLCLLAVWGGHALAVAINMTKLV
jgi:fluoride exporter